MIPFASSVRTYMEQIRHGDGFASVRPKEMARCRIAGGQRLTVPVEGGARSLGRNSDPEISQHGRWQEVHLGAWRAAYGRSPWFAHLFPEMEALYRNNTHATLSDFTDGLNAIAMKWIGDEALQDEARRFREAHPERFRAISEEMRKNIDPELSIFDALFRLGNDTLFILI